MTNGINPKTDPIRVGIIGIGRGQSFMRGAGPLLGMKVVALCDTWEEPLVKLGKEHRIATYTDYDRFLEHEMDAVILANYFHEHAPFAIKALRAGKHVMSECSCNATLAEGVELCRAVEETGLIYMLAENYPFTKFNMEMQRLYQEGKIGEVTYAEGEYNHPMKIESTLKLTPGLDHWRAWIPSTYYCTHALAPLMVITDTMPTLVNGLSIARPEVPINKIRRHDQGSVILCRMDNGSVFRLFGVTLPGHSYWYRVHGTRGAMENIRGGKGFGPGQVRTWIEKWRLKPDEVEESVYTPNWPEYNDLIGKAGHGGGDFWTSLKFAEAIRSGQQPFLDVYRGVAMSSVGILAWLSALEDGKPMEVPDFRDESSRRKVENDKRSPFPSHIKQGYPRLPSSIIKQREPSAKEIAEAEKVWQGEGYYGN